ncbi:MAG: TIGR01777 family protein [Desulfamplus sp.]|nr:TIGR01777 family protein [Desulfamplus sp.]
MKIVITGASGFVGTNLCRVLLNRGDYVIGIGTSKRLKLKHVSPEHFDWISADTTIAGNWQTAIKEADVIINLTGKNIFGYWTQKHKSQIYNSRVLTTKNIVAAMQKKGDKKQLLLNASAVGYYGNRGEDSLIESESFGNDFLAKVCVDWENGALKAEDKGARVVIMRFGVVLGKNGGALEKMLPSFKLFAGGPLGKGTHWFPWIHIDDLIGAILFFIENQTISGSVNFVAPQALRHKDFTSALGEALNRPSFMPAPAFMVKAVMGEMGKAFLSSQKAIPFVLNKSGFKFKYPDIEAALEDIL